MSKQTQYANMRILSLVLACLAGIACFAEKQPLSRYQSVIDRQMFGPLPPGFDPSKSPNEVQKSSSAAGQELTKEQEKLQSAIHFSMINVTPEGVTEVGFTDNSDPKVPVNYLLKVGETRNGWMVKEADPVAAKMTIVKDDIEVSLSLGGNSAKGGGTTARAGAGAAASPAAGGPRRLGSGLMGGGSLRSRRLMRQQEEREAKEKADAAAEAKEAARQVQAEQEKAQREAERAEQRQQLLAIQEELKRVREAKATEKSGTSDEEASGGEN